MEGYDCVGIDCSKPAKLQCPTCAKMGLKPSFFCSQACFKSNWPLHKLLHVKPETSENDNDPTKQPPLPQDFRGYVFTGPLRPWKVGPKREVPKHIPRPDYADHPKGYPESEIKVRGSTQVDIKTPEQLKDMRQCCKIAAQALELSGETAKVGVTADEIDRVVHEFIVSKGGYPSPLNYYEFPKSCCTSPNEVICHGIPDSRPLQDGDILNVDITVYYKGYHGDCSKTFLIGNVDEAGKKLVENAKECLQKAMDMVKPNVMFRDVGNVIQKTAASAGMSVVKSYCGHGIGELFHCAPNVPHYSKNKAVGVMKPGMTFTIEPMICEGTWKDTTWPDDWTAVTKDGKRSAQFEHTLVVTETGYDILTLP